MALFWPRTGWDRLRLREKRKLSFRSIQSQPGIGISKKIQKIKKHHYGFFSSQNGTGDAVNVRKKIHVLIHSHSTRNMEFQKNSKKIKKIIKRHCGFFSTQNRTGHAETEWKKVFSFRSIQPQPEIGNSKKIAKEIQKMKKKSLWLLFKPKRDGKGWEWEKKNILVPIHSNTTQNRDFQKNSQKLQKIKKHYYGFISTKNGIGLVEIERKKKIIVPIHSIPTRNRDFQKNSKKIEKIKKKKKTSMWLPLKPKRDGTNWECEEKKIIVPIHSNLT